MTATVFAASFVALFAAHQVGDFWVQTERQAAGKGRPDLIGRIYCAAHVLTYTATAAVFLAATTWMCDLHLNAWRVAAALTVSALTHYIADRRDPLRKLATWAGHRDFYRLGAPRPGRDDNPSLGTGSHALDQSYHYLWLFVAALIIA